MAIGLALVMPLIIAGDVFDWSPQATGWPALAVVAFTTWLHLRMLEDEEGTAPAERHASSATAPSSEVASRRLLADRVDVSAAKAKIADPDTDLSSIA